MTHQEAAWQHRPDIEQVEFERAHPYPFETILGDTRTTSDTPDARADRSRLIWFAFAVALSMLVLF